MRLEDEIQQDSFKSEHQKLYINLLFTGGWALALGNQMLKEHDLTVQQYNVLRILRGQHPEPASVNLLIERMIDKMSNASRLIDKLQKKGLVTRSKCMFDRRQVDVRISDKGLEVLAGLDSMDHTTSIAENISESDAKKLNDLLDSLRG